MCVHATIAARRLFAHMARPVRMHDNVYLYSNIPTVLLLLRLNCIFRIFSVRNEFDRFDHFRFALPSRHRCCDVVYFSSEIVCVLDDDDDDEDVCYLLNVWHLKVNGSDKTPKP